MHIHSFYTLLRVILSIQLFYIKKQTVHFQTMHMQINYAHCLWYAAAVKGHNHAKLRPHEPPPLLRAHHRAQHPLPSRHQHHVAAAGTRMRCKATPLATPFRHAPLACLLVVHPPPPSPRHDHALTLPFIHILSLCLVIVGP